MLKRILLALVLINLSTSAFAFCVRNPKAAFEWPWPEDWHPFDPTTGIRGDWSGGGNGGSLNMGRVNLASDLVQPVGSIMANGGPVPLTQYGEITGFQPEQVLFICSPEEEGLLFEGFVATAALYQGKRVIHPDVPDNTYATSVQRVGWRALHIESGKYFTPNWQLRPLTGLDRDIYGRILVKAKNFSAVQLEFVKVPSPVSTDVGLYEAPFIEDFTFYDPFGWVTLVSHNEGPNATPSSKLPRCKEGESSMLCVPWNVFSPYLVGPLSNIHYYTGSGGFTSYKGCQVSSVTPVVVFEPISVTDLQSGETRNGKVEVVYACENGANFGTATGANALGFKVSDASRNVANGFNFKTTGSAVTKLFSERYGDSDVALGVGIDIYPKGDSVPMNWLTSSSIGGGNLNGWYQPNGFRVNPDTESFGVYIAEYDVKLSKLPDTLAHPVTPGSVYATAELLLVVQ